MTFQKLLIISIYSIGLISCARDAATPNPPVPHDGDLRAFKKLGDLSLTRYSGKSCTAIVSGSDEPKQLLIKRQCAYENSYTLSCTSNFNCATVWEGNRRLEVGLSQDFKQFVMVWFDSKGEVWSSESYELIQQQPKI